MVTHAQKARELRDEYEAATGVQLAHPRSRVALNELRETLDRYKAALQAVQAANARRRAEKDFADKFACLGNLPIAFEEFTLTHQQAQESLKKGTPCGGPRQATDEKAPPTSLAAGDIKPRILMTSATST